MSKSILRSVLEEFSGKEVVVNIIGAITIPYVIPSFQLVCADNSFMFDDEDSENFQFDISDESINWVEYDEDDGVLSFEIEEHGFRTVLEIMCATQ